MKPWSKKYYCLPERGNGEFVAAMENILDAYHRDYKEDEVLVCMDETSKQQTMEARVPLAAKPGREAIFDSEYVRNGVSSLFMFFAPLAGWRRVDVTDRRTKRDWARQIRKLVDEDFPGKRIFLAMDNLNTHGAGSLYETFPPSEAHRILTQLTFVYTPKHGSWLNMAEIEIGAMVRQCLARRIPDQATMRKEVQAWQERRNNDQSRVDWRFRTADAFVEERRRLKIIPNAWGKRSVLKLMFGAMIRASGRWKSIRVTHFELLQMPAVRKELDEEYHQRTGPVQGPETGTNPSVLSSKKRA